MTLSIQDLVYSVQFSPGGSSTLLAAACASTPFFTGVAHAQSAPLNSMAQRVIIDTDLGVDDAFALPLAMHSKELSIEAITAVSGNLPLELTLASAAAAAVFDSGVPIVIVGLNVTERVRLNDTHVQRLEAANNSSSLARAASPETASHL